MIALVTGYKATGFLMQKSGAFGKFAWIKIVTNQIGFLQRNPNINAVLSTHMSNMSQLSRLLFVDYLTTSSNGDPRSFSIGKRINEYLVQQGYEGVDYPEEQGLLDALASMSVYAFFHGEDPANEELFNLFRDSGIIFNAHWLVLKKFVTAIMQYAVIPLVVWAAKQLGYFDPAEKQRIPGEKNPEKTRTGTNAPPVKTDTTVKSDDGADAVNATKRNADLEVVPPAEVKSEPVGTKVDTNTDVNATKSRIDPNSYKKK
jgi:hypothetical protein